MGCSNDAEFGILSEAQSSDMETHACEGHIGILLEPGMSKVYPLMPSDHVAERLAL